VWLTPLLTALLHRYLNYYHEVYYELLNSFMGKGDKVGLGTAGQHITVQVAL
jgi:hypothetical protein